MNITLGVFDLFTYATPGSLYLALITYITARLGWIDPSRIIHANTAVVIIGGIIISYLLGHVTYLIGQRFFRISPWKSDTADAPRVFAERVPAARHRPFLTAHLSVLQAAVELHEPNAAAEITRLRAVALMLRNCAPPLVLGAVVAVVDAATNTNLILSICCVAVLPLAAAGCLYSCARMYRWSDMKTLELAFWVPDIDDLLSTEGVVGHSSRVQRPARNVALNRSTTQARGTKRISRHGNQQ